MLDSLSICELYTNVLYRDMQQHCVSQEAVGIGIDSIGLVYRPSTGSLNSGRSVVVDYNDAAHRCAYMHKYAGLHTAMVKDMLSKAIELDFEFFSKLVFTDNSFNICSLGGGPGSDIIGALAALHAAYSYFNSSATVVDYMVNWDYSFDSILKELETGQYGEFGNITSYLNWRYVEANLLKSLTSDVEEAISSASLVTMVKFASAAACQDTESMLKNIFAAMKPGACVLFIDNDGGGFHKIFWDAALHCNFISIFGPLRHHNYENVLMKTKKFGYKSCYKTTIVVQIIQKQAEVMHCDPYPFRIPQKLSPLTPIFHRNVDFTEDENIKVNCFISPTRELPETPCIDTPVNNMNYPHNIKNMRSTPNTPRRRRRKNNPCLPLLKSLRPHLGRKVKKRKRKARKLFQKKNKIRKI